MTNAHSPARAARLSPEPLEDRLTPVQFTFAGATFEQNSTPDVRSLLSPGTYSGAIVTSAPVAATGSIANFPDAPAAGFDPARSLGWLVNPSGGPRGLNLPNGNNGTTQRSGAELGWTGGRAIQNAPGADLVIYESGTVSGAATAPEPVMIQVRNALTGAWSGWYYTPATASAVTSGTAGLFATTYDLSALGVGAAGYIDRIRLVNMTDEDRMVASSGIGVVIPEDNGATSTFLPAPGPLAPFGAFDANTLDPDPAYLGVVNALTGSLVDVAATITDGQTSVAPGGTVTYTITVGNSGPGAAPGTAFVADLPAGLTGVTWTSTTSTGVTGSTGSGSGDIAETLALPAGSSITYTVTATADPSAAGTILTATATVTPGATVTDASSANDAAADNTTVALTASAPPATPVAVAAPTPVRLTAVGAGAFGVALVYNADGSLRYFLTPFGGFAGAIRVATGDLNGDAVDDIVVGAGAGAFGGQVKVFSGATGAEIASYNVFPAFYTGGVSVAIGDIDGDGGRDVVVGASSLVPVVSVLDFPTGATLTTFLALPSLTGVTVAAGNLDGVGADEIVVGATSGLPLVVGYNFNRQVVGLFLGAAPGVEVSVGDLFGDGRAEILASSTTGRGGQVQLFSVGAPAVGPVALPIPMSVGIEDVDGDGDQDFTFASAAGSPSFVAAFDPASLALSRGLVPFGGLPIGVFVG